LNNVQLYLSIGLPMSVFVLTWLANRAEMNRHIDRLDRNMEGLRSDLNRETSSIRMELNAMRNDHHKDFVALLGQMVPLHERMTKLESRK
jgi:hypothetical protein